MRKQLLGDNLNIIIVFKQNDTYLNHVFEEHVSSDLTSKEFKKLCCMSWDDHYGFICIMNDLRDSRYRKGTDKYIRVE